MTDLTLPIGLNRTPLPTFRIVLPITFADTALHLFFSNIAQNPLIIFIVISRKLLHTLESIYAIITIYNLEDT